MPNPNALYQDMQKLDDMYEELLWDPDDELQFTHDGRRIIIVNTNFRQKWNTVTVELLTYYVIIGALVLELSRCSL